ncbi:hypothetical protein L0U85_13315 [Glycomyces sp. L485]|uniref:hypothetical protein n=1 Tax=Glycomyces sp. L485 TaxID=2909235 RepID=UPI001F4B50EF|nr:hypothetical protein [Glycomyces sp. L485]MCH7231824.1 hypothetical protein [Glycomyces sp. L485]
MGLFGAIGRETKGAIRSISYDVRRSKQFRRLGALAVATVAGGVLATGVLVRTPVPDLIGMQSDENGSGITDGWFGFGSDTRGQEAEPEEPESTSPNGGPAPEAPGTATPERRAAPQNGGGKATPPGEAPTSAPGLTPIEQPTGGTPEENDTESPSGEPGEGPGEEPAPTETSTTPEPTPSETPSETPTPTKSPSEEPTATKTPTDE